LGDMKASEITNRLRNTAGFYLVDPKTLDTLNDWTEYLDSLLHGPCAVWEENGELSLIETRQLVEMVRGMRISIFSREHPPPHFHVKSATVDASFRIEDCVELDGHVDRKTYDKIRYWHGLAKPKLIAIWNETRPSDCVVGEYKHAT